VEIEIFDESDRQAVYRAVDASKVGDKFKITTASTYTQKQRASLHLWCKMCAETLNDAGIYFTRDSVFGNHKIEMPWTMKLFKDHVYKHILDAMTGKKSTEQQSTVEPSDVAVVISKQYAQNGLICPAWPSAR
jgi:hypothetical protein